MLFEVSVTDVGRKEGIIGARFMGNVNHVSREVGVPSALFHPGILSEIHENTGKSCGSSLEYSLTEFQAFYMSPGD